MTTHPGCTGCSEYSLADGACARPNSHVRSPITADQLRPQTSRPRHRAGHSHARRTASTPLSGSARRQPS
jgi:hypothetical protein